MGCYFLLQGIFPTQGLSPGLLHWQVDSLPLSYQGSPCRVATGSSKSTLPPEWPPLSSQLRSFPGLPVSLEPDMGALGNHPLSPVPITAEPGDTDPTPADFLNRPHYSGSPTPLPLTHPSCLPSNTVSAGHRAVKPFTVGGRREALCPWQRS